MKLKRMMAIVLCFAMVLSTMSFSVFAEDATVTVSSYDDLAAALANDETEKTIELAADITIDTKINVPDGITINLNGNTLYVNVENSYYNDVTIKNGNIVLGKDDVHVCDGYFLVNEGKTLVLSDVNMSSSAEGIKGYAVFHLNTGANLDLIDSELDIRDNEYSEGYIVYAGESTASVDVTGTTVSGTNVNGIVHATTVIDNSTFTIGDANEHGINRSAVTINDSTVTISGGTGRGITAQHGDLVISGSSVVNISDMGEATIELRGDKNLTVDDTATVTVDVAVNNTTSGTITGDVTVDGATEPPVVNANVKIGDQGYNTLADALEATREMSGDVVIELLADANLSYGAREAYGKDDTTSITINGNNNTLTLNQTDSDWSSIGMANADGVFKMNNVNVVKTGYGVPGGAWNTHAINFNVNTELTNVDFDNSIKVSGTSVLTNVNIVEDEEFYGIWIPANATSVTINGGSITATNNGRGIKIADQYVEDSAQKVSLTVNGMTFETAKKAAVLVSSKGGADITTTNCDITKVAADSENFAWVDEDRTSSADKVTVDGGSVFVEGTTIINNINDLKAFRDDVNAGNTYEGKFVKVTSNIDIAGENWTPIGNDTHYFMGTFDGGNHTISNMTIDIDTTGNVFAGLFGGIKKATVKNLKMTNVDIDVVGAKVRAAAVVGIAHSNSENRTDATINFENITVDGCSIDATATTGSALLGGVVGYSYPANMKNIAVSDLDINGTAEAADGEVRAAAINGYVCGQNISNNGNTRAPMLVDTFEVSDATINAEGYTVFAGGYAPYTYYGYITLKNGNIDGLKITADAHEAFVGGLVGYFWRSDNGHTVENVDITGIDFDVTTDYLGETRIGGVVGTSQSPNTKYTDVSVSGKIVERCSDSANPVNYHAKVGGFVARTYEYAQQTYTNCVADVDVTGTNVVGGFVGNHNSTVSYVNCEAKGDVTGDIAGGFAGRLTEHGYTTDVTFDGCKASGTVTGTNVAGGFIGSTANHGWAAWAAGNGTAYGKNITLKDCVAAENVSTTNNTGYCAGVVGEAKVADSKELTLDNVTYSVEPAFYPAVTNVTVKTKVAQLGNEKFESLSAAITAAQPNDTITLLADVTEDVTINKSITLDGGNFKYTGNISVSGSTSEVTVKNVNFVNGTGYAVTTNRIKSITVEDCTVSNYAWGFLYANKSTPTVVVKNVTVDGGNYGFHWVYGTSATLENVTMTNVTNGLLIQNYAGKNVTLKNCNLTNINIWERDGSSGVQTFKFEGTNTVATLSASQYAKYVLTAVDATLTAPEGSDVTTDLEGYFVKNVDGTYNVAEKVVQIGDNYYSSLQDAIDSAVDNAEIKLVKDIANGTGVKVNSGKNFTLDLGGYTYTIASNPVGSKGTETLGFQLLKDSNITIKNGTITSETGSGVKLLVMNYANLTLDGVELDGANLDDVANAGGYVMSNNNGTTVIKDSTITAPTDGVAFDVDYQASYPDGAKVSLEGNTTINGAIVYEDNAQNSLTKDASVALDAPEGYKWVKVGAKYSLQATADYKFVVEADTEEIIDSGSFNVEVKVSSEKMDKFHSAEYIVTYNPDLLTCPIDNAGQDDYAGKDYDKTLGTIRLQCLDGEDVNEVIDTLTFTTKDFYLTQTATIEVSGTVCATQYDASSGSSDPVISGKDTVVLKDSFTVTVGAGLEGDTVAYNGTDYVVKVAAANQNKQNTIEYTVENADGNPVGYSVILPAGTNEYTISGDDIIGNMAFNVSDTYSIEIVKDYVTGYALILVDGSADGYTYNGHQMLKINRASGSFEYNGRYGWLVDGSAPGTTLESVKAAAYAAIRAGEESKAVETGYDVNSYINNDRKINFYDVSAAYACQKVDKDFALSDIDDYFWMELYLASDVNCDGKVDSSDSGLISVNYN